MAAAVAVSVALLAGGFVFARATEDQHTSRSLASAVATGSGSTKTVDPNQEEPIAAVAAAVSPAVVQIETRLGEAIQRR